MSARMHLLSKDAPDCLGCLVVARVTLCSICKCLRALTELSCVLQYSSRLRPYLGLDTNGMPSLLSENP